MIRLSLAIVCMILAVGAIDGPTGHEGDNFTLAFMFAITGIACNLREAAALEKYSSFTTACLYPAYILPISCRYLAYILPRSCLYPASILQFDCTPPRETLWVSSL